MKTLHVTLILIVLIFHPVKLFAQLPEWNDQMNKPDADYYQISDAAKAVFEIDPEARNSIGGIKFFNRWNWFWQYRVGKNHEGKTGSFLYADEALLNLVNNPICTSPEGVTSNWSCLGPFSQPETNNGLHDRQNMGIIVSLYVDPTDYPNYKTILAGSNSGGLWKTTNGGATWTNPDQSRLAAMMPSVMTLYIKGETLVWR